MPRLTFLAFCLVLSAGAARSEWGVASGTEEKSPNGSVTYRRTVLEDDASGVRATVDCALFASGSATLEVIDQPVSRRGLAEVMGQRNAMAGVNGGYFDLQEAPVGLLISGGRMLSPLRKAKLLTGVLFATKSKVDIVRASRFVMSNRTQAAVQCGPLLVDRGIPVAGLNGSRLARRTFAAVDGKGGAALGVSSALSLAQLSRIVARGSTTGNFKVVRALNLDGGSSTAFWFAAERRVISIPELKPVRDFVAILPKPAR